MHQLLSLQDWNPPDLYKNRPSILGSNVEASDYNSIRFEDTGMAREFGYHYHNAQPPDVVNTGMAAAFSFSPPAVPAGI